MVRRLYETLTFVYDDMNELLEHKKLMSFNGYYVVEQLEHSNDEDFRYSVEYRLEYV